MWPSPWFENRIFFPALVTIVTVRTNPSLLCCRRTRPRARRSSSSGSTSASTRPRRLWWAVICDWSVSARSELWLVSQWSVWAVIGCRWRLWTTSCWCTPSTRRWGAASPSTGSTTESSSSPPAPTQSSSSPHSPRWTNEPCISCVSDPLLLWMLQDGVLTVEAPLPTQAIENKENKWRVCCPDLETI